MDVVQKFLDRYQCVVRGNESGEAPGTPGAWRSRLWRLCPRCPGPALGWRIRFWRLPFHGLFRQRKSKCDPVVVLSKADRGPKHHFGGSTESGCHRAPHNELWLVWDCTRIEYGIQGVE